MAWKPGSRLHLKSKKWAPYQHCFHASIHGCFCCYHDKRISAGNHGEMSRCFKQLLDEIFVISRIIQVEVGLWFEAKGWGWRLLPRTWSFWISQKPNLIIVLSYIERKKNGSHVFAFALTSNNTKRANLAWLPLEIMHRGHIHDMITHNLECPWHGYCVICSYNCRWKFISIIHCLLSANEKRDSEFYL